jgi:hypothetical protein
MNMPLAILRSDKQHFILANLCVFIFPFSLQSVCRIYDSCMCSNISPFGGMDQLPQFSHLQQLLGLSTAETVELGNIVDPPIIRTATTVLPLGWNGEPGHKSADPLKVDIMGHGLHLCTLVQAYLNGNWYVLFYIFIFM